MLANVFDITSCFRLSLPCGGRLISVIHIRSMEKISTHALRGEGDDNIGSSLHGCWISIHALRGEGDCKNIQICNAMLVHSVYKTVYFCDSCAFYLT